MERLKEYFLRVAISLDQFINTFFGGHPDETFSASCYRKQYKAWYWKLARILVDAVFFWQENHCQKAYDNEINDYHLPNIYRRG